MAQAAGDAEQKKTILTDPAKVAESALSSASKTDDQQQQQHQWRGRDVVFVDPLDPSAPYWWPAMIVPTDEIDVSMGCMSLGLGEYLVKYFEDFKYSTVNGSELRLFDTTKAPFTDFATKTPHFLKDKAIKSAMWYLRSGFVHNKFRWRLWETGSETIGLPFTLALQAADTNNISAQAPVAEEEDQLQPDSPGGHLPHAESAATGLAEESDDSTLVTANLPDSEPTTAVPERLADAQPSEDIVADESHSQQQHQQQSKLSADDVQVDEETNNADAPSTGSLQPQTRAAISGDSATASSVRSLLLNHEQQQEHQQQASADLAESSHSPLEEPISAATASRNSDEINGSEEDENDIDNEEENENKDDLQNQQHQQHQHHRQQQQQQQQTATPASTATARTTPEATTPPQQEQQREQPQPRTRRTRAQRVTANGNGTGRRGRPPLSSKQGGAAKHKRNASTAVSTNGNKRTTAGPTIITDSMSTLMEDSTVDSAYATESQEIQAIIKEMEEVQEEYRFFRSLVKKAAKDLWTQMGNEWPPSIAGTSTRFGKKRKLA
ncbi:hypothetical protein LPJ64_003767 [Coemansia asiatica]|uniref:PWWP domain-containing protein n=1 Tax=Coemansia asiatica TaxID=1052880 RepID=A0A9W7XKG3_9FUNG|nr:hypothetical protein LPJ64_003767 [Coemansia asiatica]